jgi:AAA domain
LRLNLQNLNIQFKTATVNIDLAHQVIFFHGRISTGKSSIARIIDYCLGGDLVTTPALISEFVSAQLSGQIGSYDFVLDRAGQSATSVGVTWRDAQGQSATILAPLAAGISAIWGETVFNFSDLIFYLAGVEPIRVRKSKRDPDSQLVRLSIRDLLWYCYLQQEDLDSSFFNLVDDPRMYKSRDVMRFVTGYYTQELNRLEQLLEQTSEDRKTKQEAAGQIKTFLVSFGVGSEADIRTEIAQAQTELDETREQLVSLRRSHAGNTHFSDDLRARLRTLGEVLASEINSFIDLEARVLQQQKLRDELLSVKFKLSRAESASTVLMGASFETCPQCSNDLSQLERVDGTCIVCGYPPGSTQKASSINQRAEGARKDLDSRIADLELSIKHHLQNVARQKRRVEDISKNKAELDETLTQELRSYDSAFLSTARETERRAARLEEKIRGLENTARMPLALAEIERQITELLYREKDLREQIVKEKSKLTNAVEIVHELEDEYLDLLVKVGVPGITRSDTVVIGLDSWLPKICPDGDLDLAYTFYGAGSGGKKTLLKVCYALALHKVAAANDLPLPRLLIIDSPMKNIDKEVNIELFLSFYKQLYILATDQLSETQFVIIDNEFAEGPAKIDLIHRYMSPENALIPYYKGH